jgi:ankyrin repeat protein
MKKHILLFLLSLVCISQTNAIVTAEELNTASWETGNRFIEVCQQYLNENNNPNERVYIDNEAPETGDCTLIYRLMLEQNKNLAEVDNLIIQAIRQGADLDQRSFQGNETALHIMIFYAKNEQNIFGILQRIIESANPENNLNLEAQDIDGRTILHLAAEKNFFNCMQYLINNRASITARDKYQNTPLHRAIVKNSIDAIRLLLNNNADPNAQNDKGRTPLHEAVMMNRENLREVITLLLQYNADITLTNIDGKTPYEEAVQRNIRNNEIDQLNVLEEDIQDMCPICYVNPASIRFGNACIHSVCHECIVRIIENDPRCPICRTAIPQDIINAHAPHNIAPATRLNCSRAGCTNDGLQENMVVLPCCNRAMCRDCFGQMIQTMLDSGRESYDCPECLHRLFEYELLGLLG